MKFRYHIALTVIACTMLFSSPALAQFAQQGPKLVGAGALNALQGCSVAISADGNTAIVGGFGDRGPEGGADGAAWVWSRRGGAWTQQGAKLVASDATTGFDAALQGASVSISADGNTAIVGGPYDNNEAGAAWVWVRRGEVWTRQGPKLVGSGAGDGVVAAKQAILGSGSHQGFSVAISGDGNTAIVGGPGDNNGVGAAWVWTRSGGTWTQQGAKLVGSDAVGRASQGSSVALSADGNIAVIGGGGDHDGSGAAWVWTRVEGVWTQQSTKLVGDGSVGNARQGEAVAVSADGNTAIVGGPGDNNYDGAAWVWIRSGRVWTQQGTKLVGSGVVGIYAQGSAVSLSAGGNTAIIGGPANLGGQGNTGAAWIWTRSDGVWTQQTPYLVGSDAAGYQGAQGDSVSISGDGNTAIVGGDFDNRLEGAAWVFERVVPPRRRGVRH